MTVGNVPYVVWFEDCHAGATDLVGGKCASLGELHRVPVTVPSGFAVTTHAHREFMDRHGIAEHASAVVADVDMHDAAAVDEAARMVRQVFAEADIPPSVEDSVLGAYDRLCERSRTEELAVAVRSSATAEDNVSASFAGQLETYLWLRNPDEILDGIVRCWSALFEPHAADYCRQLGVRFDQVFMSTAVQRMVEARSAGVMFTLNPVNGDRSKVMIESCWGLGEGIVTGEVDPDRYAVDKVTLEILDRHEGNKTFAYRPDRTTGGVSAQETRPDEATVPSLRDDEIVAMAELGKRVEAYYGAPQDIEWAIGGVAGSDDASELYILQSRPETVASNISESVTDGTSRSALDFVVKDMVSRGGEDAS